MRVTTHHDVSVERWATNNGDSNNLNSGRLPVFARVDLRVRFRPRWQDSRWQIYVEAINLLNRKNAGTLSSVLEYDPASDRPRVSTTKDGSLPLLPSFGVRFTF